MEVGALVVSRHLVCVSVDVACERELQRHKPCPGVTGASTMQTAMQLCCKAVDADADAVDVRTLLR